MRKSARSFSLVESNDPWTRYKGMSASKKFILAVFVIWLAQALPKWIFAVTADGELSAEIMKVFITPRSDRIDNYPVQVNLGIDLVTQSPLKDSD